MFVAAVGKGTHMALACPQCNQTFEQGSICPLCNVILLYHAPNLQTLSSASSLSLQMDESTSWQRTPWGKIAIGLILAQGLNFGLQQLVTAGFLAAGGGDVWATLIGLALHHAVLGFSLIVGGALSGAGQCRGIVYGAIVGVASGVISLFLHDARSQAYPQIFIYTVPIIHMFIGGLGGALGMLVWKPTPTLPELDNNSPTSVGDTFALSLGRLFAGQLHPGRIAVGAFIIVMGVVWSSAILDFILRASGGTLTITSRLQAQFVTMEVAAIIALAGSAFAGATTYNGFKQGLCVGLGACSIVLGLQFNDPKFTLESAVTTGFGTVIISLVGGWFGSQLFPPINSSPRRRKLI